MGRFFNDGLLVLHFHLRFIGSDGMSLLSFDATGLKLGQDIQVRQIAFGQKGSFRAKFGNPT